MPRFFGTVFYEVGVAGWSEVYPLNSASYASAFTELDNLNTLRLAMATPDVHTNGSRVSDTDVLRDSFEMPLTTNAGTYITGGATTSGDADDTFRALAQAGALKRGMRQLHALPGILFVNGIFTPSGAWLTAYGNWTTALIANVSIATKIRGAVAPPFYVFNSITTVTGRGNGNRKVGRPSGLPRGRRSIV